MQDVFLLSGFTYPVKAIKCQWANPGVSQRSYSENIWPLSNTNEFADSRVTEPTRIWDNMRLYSSRALKSCMDVVQQDWKRHTALLTFSRFAARKESWKKCWLWKLEVISMTALSVRHRRTWWIITVIPLQWFSHSFYSLVTLNCLSALKDTASVIWISSNPAPVSSLWSDNISTTMSVVWRFF